MQKICFVQVVVINDSTKQIKVLNTGDKVMLNLLTGDKRKDDIDATRNKRYI